MTTSEQMPIDDRIVLFRFRRDMYEKGTPLKYVPTQIQRDNRFTNVFLSMYRSSLL